MKHAGGRPTKLTPEAHQTIVEAIQAGNYIETASAMAGIEKPTLYDWLKRGADERARVNKSARLRILKDERIYVEFSYAVAAAMGQSEARSLARIAFAGQNHRVVKHRQAVTKDGDVVDLTDTWTEFDWRAEAWRMERRFPERWGRKEKHEISGPDGGPVEIKTIADILGEEEDGDGE